MAIFGKSKKQKLLELRDKLLSEANNWLDDLNKKRDLKPVKTDVMLKKGEEAFFNEQTVLFEKKSVTYRQSNRSGGAVRIAKGVYMGGSSGQGKSETTQEWRQIDSGIVTITNKRIIFSGKGVNKNIPLKKVISTDISSLNTITIATESSSRNIMFSLSNPYIFTIVFRVLIFCPDPHKLDKVIIDLG